jgi:hypothetical protein
MDAHEADRLARLEAQLQEMVGTLESERRQHKEETQAMATKLRVLEAQAKAAVDGKQLESTRVKGASMGYGERSSAVGTPRTADNLFVAIPSRHNSGARSTAVHRTASQAQRSAPRDGRTGVSARSTKGPVGGGSSVNAAKTPATSPERQPQLNASQRRATALQHAWDKFCATARTEFAPKELALVSAETLHSLMDHYKIRSSIERAQIEGQWALLQEGKASVGENATPKPTPNSKRPPVKRAAHPTAFDLGGDLGKPHLTSRVLLQPEGIRPSDPNQTTSGSALVRSQSATVLLRPRDVGASNPNETQTRSESMKLCFARTQSPTASKDTPRGMRHVTGPQSGEFTPRGIRSNGHAQMGGDAVRPYGVKCHIDPTHEDRTPRRGVRTFDRFGSPTREPRSTIHVATPPHLDRVHLLTGTLANGGDWPRRTRMDEHQRRTPFALGDN